MNKKFIFKAMTIWALLQCSAAGPGTASTGASQRSQHHR